MGTIDIKKLFSEIDKLESENDRLRNEVEFYRLELSISGNGKIIPKKNINLKKELAAARAKISKLNSMISSDNRKRTLNYYDSSCEQAKVCSSKSTTTKKKRIKIEDSFRIFKEFLRYNPKSDRRTILARTGLTESVLSSVLSKFKNEILFEKDPNNRRKRIYSVK